MRDNDRRHKLAGLTNARKIIDDAPVSIAVFADRKAMYNDVKDHQAMGACIQNMLLAAHALNLASVWLGEILHNTDKVASQGYLGSTAAGILIRHPPPFRNPADFDDTLWQFHRRHPDSTASSTAG